jgi:hypothetical protein
MGRSAAAGSASGDFGVVVVKIGQAHFHRRTNSKAERLG